jgi:hypothetical protein
MEHIILFMQENRPFDHYFGSMSGVRGFNDRAAPKLPSGKSPFYQPISKINPTDTFCGCGACDFEWINGGGEIMSLFTTMSCSNFD